MDLLCFYVLCLLCLCARLFICGLWSPAGKGLTSWLSFVVSNCECRHFPVGIQGQVWYLIVSIPDLCTITNIDGMLRIKSNKIQQNVSILTHRMQLRHHHTIATMLNTLLSVNAAGRLLPLLFQSNI